MPRPSRYAIGIDIGGTSVKMGIVSLRHGTVSRFQTFPTPRQKKKCVAELTRQIDMLFKIGRTIDGIGIGAPGPIDLRRGVILNPLNVKALWHTPLVRILERRYRRPIHLANDADSFVWGEATFGAAKKEKHVLGITLGTGIGAGLVINGELYQGAHNSAAEIWFNPYQAGIANDYVSSQGLLTLHRKVTHSLVDSPQKIKSTRTWRIYGQRLAEVMAPAVNCCDPAMIVIGGGISYAYPFFITALRAALRRLILPAIRNDLKIRQGKHQTSVVGAAALVKRRL